MVLVRVGGGYERFEKYLASNHDQFGTTLVTHMTNNEWTLNQVVEKLIKGERIKTNLVAKRNIQLTFVTEQKTSMIDANR